MASRYLQAYQRIIARERAHPELLPAPPIRREWPEMLMEEVARHGCQNMTTETREATSTAVSSTAG